MRILIDFSQIPINRVGVGVYAIETFRLMFQDHLADKFNVVVQNDDSELISEFENFKNINVIKICARIFRKLPFRLLLEQFYIPYLSKKLKVDIIHSLHYSFPLVKTKAKKVITIHDLTFFIYPKLHTRIKRHYFKLFTVLASKTNNNLICVSNSTAKDLRHYIPHINSAVDVIPLASDLRKNQNGISKSTLISSLPTKYILFIGTLEPRKNIDGLLKAYDLIKFQTDLKLVIVGKKGWYYDSIFEYIKASNLENYVYFTGFVTEEEKIEILRRSSIFVYPSFYEGFGLPVLEAISMGIPTITSNISSLPEVGGDAVVLVNPNDVRDIAKQMLALINDQSMQRELIDKGISQASKFSWRKTSDLTYHLYKSLNSRNK